MYKIKQLPEDFMVEEITRFGNNIEVKDTGKYIYCTLKKKNYTTLKALQLISYKLNLALNNLGFAGNKDKAAVTEQSISIYDPGNRARAQIDRFNSEYTPKGINLKVVGYGDCPISLGELKGNKFKIVIRNLGNKEILKLKKLDIASLKITNLYGEQRFSLNNMEIGKLLILKKFKDAAALLMKTEGEIENKIEKYLENNKNDYVNALKTVPKKLLLMYVHAYQSYLWNIAAKKILKKIKTEKKINIVIPIIGFGTEIEKIEDKAIKKVILDILKKENITPRDFIIRQLPNITAEGTIRDLYCEVNDLKISSFEDDELNTDKRKITLEFTLQKASYATEVVRQIFE